MKRSVLALTISVFALASAHAQSPAPVAAATPLAEAVKLLQDMKAANAEVLKKQEAALQQLEELQKAADEIKIFSKRS